MAQFGCGGARCTCRVIAGPGATVTGNGSPGSPYVIGAGPTPVTCDQVRPCISAGDGASYDPATGVVSARPSTDAGNTLDFGTDGGLLVPAPAPLETACGLIGDGSAGAPLAAAVAAWPYACDLDTEGGGVYCDSTGQLRGEPRPVADYQQQVIDTGYPATPVPTAAEEVVEVRDFTITNPDPCRAAFVMLEMELDVDFDIPPGGGAMAAIADDDVFYMENTGTTTMDKVHAQACKVFNRTIPPGGTLAVPFSVRMGRGSGGATFDRIQTAQRAYIFVL